jgi:hypothetical protein
MATLVVSRRINGSALELSQVEGKTLDHNGSTVETFLVSSSLNSGSMTFPLIPKQYLVESGKIA